MNRIHTLLFCFLSLTLSAQDTTWYNSYREECSKRKAAYYRPDPKLVSGLYEVRDYYIDGTRQFEGFSKDAASEKWEGNAVWYYPDGETYQTSFYKNGVEEGKPTIYFGNGKPAMERNFTNGISNNLVTYYYSGQLKSRAGYTGEKLHGEYVSFYRDGKPNLKGNYVNGLKEGHWLEYHPNGKLKADYETKGGVLYGKFTSYNEQGEVEASGVFKGDKVVSFDFNKENKQGAWRKTARIEKGVEIWKLYRNKALVMEYCYRGKVRTGTWKLYSADGKQIIESLEFTSETSVDEGNKGDSYFSPVVYSKLSRYVLLKPYELNRSLDAHYKKFAKNGKVVEEGDYVNGSARNWTKPQQGVEMPEHPLLATAVEYTVEVENKDYPSLEKAWLQPATQRTELVEGDTVFESTTTFDGLTIISSCSDDRDLLLDRKARRKPGQNEILFYADSYTGEQDHYRYCDIWMGKTALEKVKRQIVIDTDLAAVIHQTMPEQKFSKRLILDAFKVAVISSTEEEIMEEEPSVGGLEDYIVMEAAVVEEELREEEMAFTLVEQMPEFPGGDEALLKYIQDNLRYPQVERDNDVQGTVYITFVVKQDGTVSDAKIARGVSRGLDQEALRIAQSLPQFKPGKQQGKPVDVRYALPIRFKLQ